MMVVFFAVPVVFMVLTLFYVDRMICKGLTFIHKEPKKRKQKLIVFVIVLILVAPAFSLYRVWTIVLLHFVAFSLVFDLIHMIAQKVLRGKLPKPIQIVYYSHVLVILLVAFVLGYGYYNMTDIVKTEYMVTTEKPLREEGYRIALLTDLHIGNSLTVEDLRIQVERISQEDVDFVVLCGDIVDESTTKEQMKKTFEALGEITSRYGVYFVYGNHDSSSYSRKPNYTSMELRDAILKAGITILDDSSITINDELVLVGRADLSFGYENERASAAELMTGLDTKKEIILLDHRPCEYNEVKAAGYDMILSGHTHAGQIWPAGFLAKLLKFDDFNYGYKKLNQLNAIVSSGMSGWGYPIRTEKHSEYVIITLQTKS